MVPPRPEALGVCTSTLTISRRARTASRMTSVCPTFVIGSSLCDPYRAEPRLDRRPVQRVEPCRDIVGSLVLVFQVVRVLPHVDAQDRGEPLHERAVLVRIALDRHLSVLVSQQPGPAAAELAGPGLSELLFERVVAPKGALDRVA